MTMLKGLPELRKEVVTLATAKRRGRETAVLRMAHAGLLQKLRPGVYRSATRGTWAHQDLADACLAVPEGVICLVSALSYHGLTTTIPGETWIAIPKTTWVPRMAFPTRFIRLEAAAQAAGIETIKIGGTKVRIYSKAKTVCDALRFRDKVGVDVAFEALKTFLRQGGRPDELIQWETVCRVKTTLRGYLSVLLA
jgi:predicted transcriptional regulator of viral defense system